MKTGFYLLVLLLPFSMISAQDPKDILRKSVDACRSVTHGYYEMTRHMKYMSGPDTSSRTQICHFKKLPGDTIFHSAFHYTQPLDSLHAFHVLYTGDAFATYSDQDSAGQVMVRDMWADKINDYKHNYNLYDPLTHKKNSPLPDEEELSDSTYTFRYIGTETIHDIRCHHIRVNALPEYDPEEPMQTLRMEYHFWIAQHDHIPVRYSVAYDLAMSHDTMYQYEMIQLDRYTLNGLPDTAFISLASIPAYVTLKDYTPYTSPKLLPVDTVAPVWTLPALDGRDISLEGLQGKVVLIDFFYKSCYPCMQAIPGLQALHETYADRGLVVIGLDPFDTEEQLTGFLAKRGVTYPVVLEGKPAANAYRVSAYPTVYILDKNSRVVYAGAGYGEGKDKEYEEVILRHL